MKKLVSTTAVLLYNVAVLLCAALAAVMVPSSLIAQSVQAPVNLGTAGNYVILSEAGITNVPTSSIVGNIGAGPITEIGRASCRERV